MYISGTYKLEVYGAQGGALGGTSGGKGGYSSGTVYLEKGTILYIGVGGSGNTTTSTSNGAGGYNGGSGGYYSNDGAAGRNTTFASGGGLTHIATQDGTLSSIGAANISKVLIVAGGGGGASSNFRYDSSGKICTVAIQGGSGGGTNGGDPIKSASGGDGGYAPTNVRGTPSGIPYLGNKMYFGVGAGVGAGAGYCGGYGLNNSYGSGCGGGCGYISQTLNAQSSSNAQRAGNGLAIITLQ